MAVAYEPLSKKQIAGFSGVKLEDVDTVLNKITQFLSESLDERLDKKTYRFYHS
ncbi:hypothetical protein [Nostoc sp.]|uniref:hypothetical protein n=1 Tax=Nostoc sp. TaxID=1180 RepID=UPI002FFC33BB